MTSECGKVLAGGRFAQAPVIAPSPVHARTMLLSLPLEIWEMISDLLAGQDLQLTPKV